jgi:hypothetical protein
MIFFNEERDISEGEAIVRDLVPLTGARQRHNGLLAGRNINLPL